MAGRIKISPTRLVAEDAMDNDRRRSLPRTLRPGCHEQPIPRATNASNQCNQCACFACIGCTGCLHWLHWLLALVALVACIGCPRCGCPAGGRGGPFHARREDDAAKEALERRRSHGKKERCVQGCEDRRGGEQGLSMSWFRGAL